MFKRIEYQHQTPYGKRGLFNWGITFKLWVGIPRRRK